MRSSVLKMAKFLNMFCKSNKVFADELNKEQERWRAKMVVWGMNNKRDVTERPG